MPKQSEMFDHTADIGLAGRGGSLGELFEAMAEGLARFICPAGAAEGETVRTVAVAAEDVEALLVDFLWQVMTIVQFEHLVVAAVRVEEISETSVRAALRCAAFDPARHEMANEVKAVTYHQISVAREGAGWSGRVILDL